MKILFVHNRYQQQGGEDVIFDQEVNLLKLAGFDIETLVFNNQKLSDSTLKSKILGGIKTVYNYESVKIIKKAIDNFNPDIVHIHNLFYTASPAIIRAVKSLNVPVVMTLHNYRLICAGVFLTREDETPCERCVSKLFPIDGIKYSCFRNSKLQTTQLTLVTSLHKLIKTWKSVDRYIVLTDFAKSKFLHSSLFLKSDQISVKPNSIGDLGYVNPIDRGKSLLFVGRLSLEKGINTLLEAIKLEPNISIKIIGDGPLRSAVEEVCAMFPSVEYLGHQSRDKVIENLKTCRSLIIPSIWYEGLPTVLLEALSTGTPLICADNPNLRSITGDVSHFFSTGDYFDLASKLKKIYDTKVENSEAIKLRQKYEENYSHTEVIKQQIKIYSDLCINKELNLPRVAV